MKAEFVDEHGEPVTDVLCQYSARHFSESVPATDVVDCGPVGQVPACEACAAFMARMRG